MFLSRQDDKKRQMLTESIGTTVKILLPKEGSVPNPEALGIMLSLLFRVTSTTWSICQYGFHCPEGNNEHWKDPLHLFVLSSGKEL